MPGDRRRPDGDIALVHSSDLHIDDSGGCGPDQATAALRAVLATARALEADLVLLAGDTFDHHAIGAPTLAHAGALLAAAGRPVVILPGNHDPALPDCLCIRGDFAAIPGVSILGITHERAVAFPEYGLEIWGNAHRDYHDMVPLHDPPPRAMRWQVAMGHGHYEPPETWANPLRPSWLISDAAIAATGADYVALGHWDRPAQVGDGTVPAFYSGAPDYARTVNLVRLTRRGVLVSREPLSAAAAAQG